MLVQFANFIHIDQATKKRNIAATYANVEESWIASL